MGSSILSAQIDESPINPTLLTGKIKEEIKSTNKAYPKRNIAHECRYLNLAEFLVSHDPT